MARSEAQCKATVLPGTIQVVASIVTTHIVTNPLTVTMNVRDIRMAFRIAEIALLCKTLVTLALVSLTLVTLALFRLALFGGALLPLSLPLLRSPLLRSSLPSSRRRAVLGNISATDATLFPCCSPPPRCPRSRSCAKPGIERLSDSNARSTIFVFIIASTLIDASRP